MNVKRKKPFRRFKATSLGDLTKPLVKRAMGKSVPAVLALLQNWNQIAPAEFRGISRPIKIRFPKRDLSRNGTLDLDVQPEAAFIVQHSTPKLITAINLYFGYPAIERVSVRQVSFADPARLQTQTPGPYAEPFAFTAKPVTGIKDPQLAQSLANLAASVAGRSSRKRQDK